MTTQERLELLLELLALSDMSDAPAPEMEPSMVQEEAQQEGEELKDFVTCSG